MKMVDYLIGLGHRRIAIIVAEPYEESIGQLRLEGYVDALKKNGIQPDTALVFQTSDEISHFSMENGYCTAKRLVESGVDFTALYAVSDVLAIGAIRALLESGRKVPDDVSVAGYDGIDVSGYISPSLTTIRQPVEAMAKDTVKLLFDIIAGKKDHQHITYEAELLERESTKAI